MKVIYIGFLLFLSTVPLYSQVHYFNRTYDYEQGYETAFSVLQLEDGSYMMLSTGGKTYYTFVISKISQSGDVLWHKSYEKDSSYYYSGIGGSLIKTNDGNFAFGGTIDNIAKGNYDAMLVKFDNNGDTLWVETFGGDSDDVVYTCRQTKDSGYVLCGYTYSFDDIWEGNVYLVKTDSKGKFEWQQTYGKGLRDKGYTLEVTSDGGFIIGGSTETNGGSIYVIKTDSSGNEEWSQIINVNNPGQGGGAFQSKDGNFIVYSSKIINTENEEGYIAKISSLTHYVIWDTTFGNNYNDWLEAMSELDDGSFIAVGTSEDDSMADRGWIVKLNIDGGKLWSKVFKTDKSIQFWDVQPTSDKGFIIAGDILYGASGTQDMYLVKMDSTGYTCEPVECDSIVSVDEIDTTIPSDTLFSFQLYPNPFTGNTSINTYLPADIEKGELVIYDITGRMIHLLSLIKGLNNITLSATVLNKGVYIYKLLGDGNVVASGKMVVY